MKYLRLLLVSLTVLAVGSISTLAESPRAKGPKPEHIAYGSAVDISAFLVHGKTTVFDFTSHYCPPCRAIAPHLEKLHETREDIVVVKVDINRPNVKGIDWNSPVARQYKLESVPHFKVYGPDGKLISEGKPASTLVYGWLDSR